MPPRSGAGAQFGRTNGGSQGQEICFDQFRSAESGMRVSERFKTQWTPWAA